MTAYQQGFAIGRRCRVARIPVFFDRAERARWRSGFHDGSVARTLSERALRSPWAFI